MSAVTCLPIFTIIESGLNVEAGISNNRSRGGHLKVVFMETQQQRELPNWTTINIIIIVSIIGERHNVIVINVIQYVIYQHNNHKRQRTLQK